MSELPASSPSTLSFEDDGSELKLTWDGEGVLEAAEDLNGPWTAVSSSTLSPYLVPFEASPRFYRLR